MSVGTAAAQAQAQETPTRRAVNSQEESRPGARGSDWRGRNLAGPSLLVMSLGVLLMAAVANAGRSGSTGTLLQVGWVAGLVVVFAPAAVRIVMRETPVVERVILAIGLGLILQFSRLVLNPTSFAFHDEFIHAETLRQISESGRLFSFNPLLPVSAYYPGLEVMTDAVERLTGLPAFAAATVVLMIARLIMVLGVIGLIRIVTGSYRAGAVGVLVYVTNPQLLFFNSQYSYQTLALPLALLAIYLFAIRRRGGRFSLVLPLGVTAAVVFTHHLTAVLLILTYVLWLALQFVRGRRLAAGLESQTFDQRARVARIERRDTGILTLSSLVLLAISVANPGNPIASYLGSIAGSSGTSVLDLTVGQNSKALFSDSAGAGPTGWEQVLLISAVLIAMASLLVVFGYIRINWRASRPLALLIGIVAVLYPIIPISHLTSATAEVGDRASGFVFIGTAVVIGGWWWQRRRSGRVQVVFACLCTAVFLGNVVLGAGPTAEQIPGPYEISADARSVDASNLAAANWENTELPRDSVVYADRTSGLLAAAIGGQDTILHVSTNIDASRLLLAPTVTSADIALIRKTKLDYLIVDTRLSSGLPHQQVYIESGEYGELGRTKPVTAEALDKFAGVKGVERIYDNGSLMIYDVRGLR